MGKVRAEDDGYMMERVVRQHTAYDGRRMGKVEYIRWLWRQRFVWGGCLLRQESAASVAAEIRQREGMIENDDENYGGRKDENKRR